MKATEQYFPVVLFNLLYKAALAFESADKILKRNLTIQMKATEQYFPLVMVITLYNVVVTFESRLLKSWARLFTQRFSPNLMLNRRNFRLTDFNCGLVLFLEDKLTLTSG